MRYRLHKLLYGPVGSTQTEHLDRGPTKFDDDLQVGFLRGALTFIRLIDAVMVRGQVDTEVTVQCARSLDDFDLALPVVLDDILFTLAGHATDEPDRQITDDGWIDLTETLREEIIMAIPFNPINPAFADGDVAEAADEFSEKDREWLTVKWGNSSNSANGAANQDGLVDTRTDSLDGPRT